VAGRIQHHLTHQTSVCGGGGQCFIPHIRHQPMEGMRTALSHTSGTSSWRGWALHYPTHRASACGGDGHRVLPHIRQALPGSGRLLCNGWVAPKGPHHMITRGSCYVDTHAALQLVGGSHPGSPSRWEQVESAIFVFNMVLFGQALFWCIGVQVVSLC
jgi:hypothetical protein